MDGAAACCNCRCLERIDCLAFCAILPSRPDLSGPVALTVVGDEIAFVQCIAPKVSAYAVSLAIHEERPEGRTWLVISADSGGSTSTSLPAERGVSADTLDGDLDRSGEENVHVSELDDEISAFLVISTEELTVAQRFPSIQVDELRPEMFVYPSGDVSTEPCGMPGAFE